MRLKNFWGLESLNPSCSQFHGMALARVGYIETWQKRWTNTHLIRKRKIKIIQKDAFNSPYAVCGTKELYKCALVWVSAFFSAFLRGFEPRELAKLVGQQNLFRDLGFFFFFLLSLKLFPLTSQRACTWKSERENRECGRARLWLSGKGSKSVTKHVYIYCFFLFCFFIGIIFGSWASCFRSCVICTVSRQLAWFAAWTASSAGTWRQGGWDYFICTRLNNCF